MRSIAAVLCVLATGWATSAPAVEIEKLSVTKDGSVFSTQARFWIEAPLDTVFSAFTDFDNLAATNPSVVASRSEVASDGRLLVATRLRDCVAFFCRSISLVETVSVVDGHTLHSTIVPETSDFHSGRSTWRFDVDGPRTRIHYESHMEPEFWLPPGLSRRLLQRALKRQIVAAASNLEADFKR